MATKKKARKKPATAKQLKARAAFKVNAAKVQKLLDSGKAKTRASAWAKIKK